MADDPNAGDRFPYPGGNVVGVLIDDAALDVARDRLEQAGFAPDRYVVGVSVGEDEMAKQRAAEALRAGDAQFLNYYADNYVEDLGGTG